jgi:hypothetical protein
MKIETRNQTINNIEDKVIVVNTLHKHINKVTPKIIELLKDNLTLKKDNSLSKNNSFGLLTFSIRYKNQYIKEDVYLWDNVREWCSVRSEFITTSVNLREFTPRKTKTIKQVKNAIKKVNTLNNKIETLNDTIRSEINRFNNFLERV